jgi:hypothetical protein
MRIRGKCLRITKKLQADTGEVERILKALIKSLENKHSNP